MDRDTLLDLLADYVLGVLDADERRQIERTLRQDAAFQQQADDYQFILDAIALTAPQHLPPPHLEQKLHQRIQRRRVQYAMRVLGVVATLVIVVLGILLLPRRSIEQSYQQLRANPQSQQIALVPDDEQISGQLVYFDQNAIIQVNNVPPLAGGQIYQLWLVDESGTASGGLYRLSAGTNYIQVPITKPLEQYKRLGMSLEPETGSPLLTQPSGPRIFNIPIR